MEIQRKRNVKWEEEANNKNTCIGSYGMDGNLIASQKHVTF